MFYGCNIKNDVEYSLDKNIRNEIIKIRDICIYRLKNAYIIIWF